MQTIQQNFRKSMSEVFNNADVVTKLLIFTKKSSLTKTFNYMPTKFLSGNFFKSVVRDANAFRQNGVQLRGPLKPISIKLV